MKYHCNQEYHLEYRVAPLAGAWIEIVKNKLRKEKQWSLPSRERGLKYTDNNYTDLDKMSLPSRERGLKSLISFHHLNILVAPLAGAWIEIMANVKILTIMLCRSPRGSVD